MALTTRTVTARYVHTNGAPATGHVTFRPNAVVTAPDDDAIMPPYDLRVPLDATGALSVNLVCTDNAGLVPQGWVYRVTESIQGTPHRSYLVELPAGEDALDLADASPLSTAPTLTEYLRVTGGTVAGEVTVNAVGTDEEPPDVLVGGDTGLSILSSFEGGEDDGTGTDTTGRINLYSYQRASTYSFGENIRHFMMRGNAKSMDAWYFPDGGYDEGLEPVGRFKPVVWTGAHWQANDGLSNHKHWSVETPDSTGAIQTRFEIRFGDTSVNDAIAGLDKTLIMTNLADFVVRCTNGQEFRLAASAGTSKGVMFSNDSEGGAQYRRWRIEATSDAESGGGVGTNFRVTRYDDTGERIDDPISISRATGNVTLGPGFIARRTTASVSSVSLNSTSLGGGEGVIAIGNAATPPPNTPSGGGVLYVEDGALKYKGSSGTVTTIAPA